MLEVPPPPGCNPCEVGMICPGGNDYPESCPAGMMTLTTGARTNQQCGKKEERGGGSRSAGSVRVGDLACLSAKAMPFISKSFSNTDFSRAALLG